MFYINLTCFEFQWTKYFGGQNFRRTKIFGGQNFRQQVRFSAVLSAEILSDKVCSIVLNCFLKVIVRLTLHLVLSQNILILTWCSPLSFILTILAFYFDPLINPIAHRHAVKVNEPTVEEDEDFELPEDYQPFMQVGFSSVTPTFSTLGWGGSF